MRTKAVRMYGKNDLRLEEFELPQMKEDEVLVKVLEIDDKGRLNLSRRDALIEVEGLTPENEISDAPRRPRRDDRRGSNGFRPNNNRSRN